VNKSTRQRVHACLFFLGILIIIIGIATRTPGAGIIGLITAVVNFQLWQKTTAHSG
jgi:hypothetical protein